VDYTKVNNIDFTSLEHLERFRQMKFSIFDALVIMLLICDDNDIDIINNIPR